MEFNGHCGPSYWRTRSLRCANTGWNWCSSVALPGPSYKCGHCDYVYDPTVADPDRGCDPIANFDELDVGWKCPQCQGPKQDFVEHEDPYTAMRGHTIVLNDHQHDGRIWDDATWAHFLTCWVGAPDGLAQYVADNGIAAAMGYEKTIAIGSCYAEWTEHFHDQAKTKTLYQAGADTLDWWRQGTDHYWPNDPRYYDDYGGYTSKRFCGDPSTRLQVEHNQ